MKRLAWDEIEDKPWFPSYLRDKMTDFLHFQEEMMQIYAPAVPLLARALAESKSTEIVDLCSGGVGPVIQMQQWLQKETGTLYPVTLTDKYPNLSAFSRAEQRSQGNIQHRSDSIDATQVPSELGGFRTLFSCFHHFPPDLAASIVRDAFVQRRGIAIFEATRRGLLSAALLGLSVPVATLATTPFLRPFGLGRLFFTYAVPVLPALIAYDGVISVLRSYEPDEMLAMTQDLSAPDYHWEAGSVRHPLLPPPQMMTYLLGYPRAV
jgi:hypothetical protein